MRRIAFSMTSFANTRPVVLPTSCRAAPKAESGTIAARRARKMLSSRGGRRAAMAAVTSSGSNSIASECRWEGSPARSSSSTRHPSARANSSKRSCRIILRVGLIAPVTGITPPPPSFSMQQFHRKVFRMLALCPRGHELPGHPPNCEPICTDVRVIQVFVAGSRYLRTGDLVWPQQNRNCIRRIERHGTHFPPRLQAAGARGTLHPLWSSRV